MYLCYIFFIFTSTPSGAPRLNTFFAQVIVSKVPTHMFLGGPGGPSAKGFFTKKNLAGKSRWCFFVEESVTTRNRKFCFELFVISIISYQMKTRSKKKKRPLSKVPKKKSEKFTKKLEPLLLLAARRSRGFLG